MPGITIEKIRTIFKVIENIDKKVVLVGGAAASFYVESPKSEELRFTKDLDLVFEILSFGELEKLRQGLIDVGFKQIADKVLCRFSYLGILVDVMSVNEVGWAPGNRWFRSGFFKAEKKIVDNSEIFLLPISYYLATKFSAFFDRGSADPYLSHDLEDIAYVLDNNMDFYKKLLANDDYEVRKFLRESFKEIIDSPALKEAFTGHLPFYFQEERIQRIEKNISLYLSF